MKRFSTLELDVVPVPARSDPGEREEFRDAGRFSLANLHPAIPRGLYRMSFSTRTPDGQYLAEIHHANKGSDGRQGIVWLRLTVRNGKASGQFVVPEQADALSLKVIDPLLLYGTGKVKLQRLSSLGVKAFRIAGLLAKQVSHPSRLPGVAVRAARRLRRGGLAGLLRALDERQHEEGLEREFERRYARWAAEEDKRLTRERSRLTKESHQLGDRPLISIVMPVFDPPVDVLQQAIESARQQIWPHWELCIADDLSTNKKVRETIRAAAAKDPRIKSVFRQTNGHISEASNSALALATGEWVTFLDHDDLLAPHALLEIARALAARPDAEMVYSDEDKIDAEGNRCRPHFKPDWNPELAHSYNLVTHIACYPTQTVRRIGGFRKGYEGAQDYDLVLRMSEITDPARIVHIPRILYHWRMLPQSAASSTNAKPYAMLAGERALNDHYGRTGIRAMAKLERGSYRTYNSTPDNPPLVSIVIATRDRLDLLKRCIHSILENTDYRHFEIVVVDNGSKEHATLDWLRKMSDAEKIRVFRDDGPFNFSALSNEGVAFARGEIVALVNNDVEVLSSGWLGEMVAHCLRPGVGVVGAKLYYPEGTVQHAGLVLNTNVVARHWFAGTPGTHVGPHLRLTSSQALSAVTGACLVTPKKLYEELGGLDAEHLAVSFNDVDYCLKAIEAGYRVVFTPHAELVHRESASRGKDVTPAKSERLYAEMTFMKKKWGKVLERDAMAMPGLPAELGEPDSHMDG